MPPRPGGDAYPSGTPPYGAPSDPAFSRAGQNGTSQEPPAEEPRTEQTLTTRIRINIPGSRPIPPVVVRSPMPTAGSGNGPERADDPAVPGNPRHRSDTGSSPVLGVMDSSNGSATMPELPMEWRTQSAAATPAAPGAASGPAGEAEAPSTWFAPRKKGSTASPSAPEPAAEPAPEPFRFEPPAFERPPYDPATAQAPFQPVYQQQPYGTPQPPIAPQAATQAPPMAPAPPPAPAAPSGRRQPLAPRPTPAPGTGMDAGFGSGIGRPPGMNGGLSVGAADALESTAAMPMFRDPAPTSAPTSAPAAAPALVPDGFAGGTGGAGAPPRKPGDAAAAAPATTPAAAARKPARGGRSRKLLVTGIGVLVLASGVVYGAGLMLNQADVPKGTTVLGQNIGGDTRDAAVHTLDGSVGVLATQPLQLVVGGKNVQLNPSVAGLTIDTTATVQGVAHHSYNPVAVVDSLFGGNHAVAPVVRIDQDKLRSALQQLAGSASGGAREGSVHFDADGTIVPVLPQTGQTLDVNASMALVQQAYQDRAAGLPGKPVSLPATTLQPKVTAAAVQAAADSLGKWAMGAKFKVVVHGVTVLFGPKTFSKSLTLQADAGGKLVPSFDLTKLQDAYAGQFDGLKINHNGVPGPVTPQDVATALTQLLSKPGGSHSITL
ncbi:hypothetical protein ABIA33_001302 [Streptacidiphilus sp. MAP12-16]|uniref:hypothetical protein n=1 Tax=Streptacidiphilus sp. MAP12-16 TaxID=3156300 RepID=UPI0035169138